MTMPAAPPPGGWAITGQRQTQQLPPGSQQFVQGVEVTFVTGYNVTSSVFVPYSAYTPTRVAAAVSERAAQLDAVSTLTHTTPV
jgi:hypothetical protein